MTAEIINLIGLVGIIAIAGFAIKTNVDINRKVDGTFKRLDKVKEDFEAKHVRKDVCSIVHDQVKEDLTEIKCDVKKLLQR